VTNLAGFSFDDEPTVNSQDELTVATHSGRSLFFSYSDQHAEAGWRRPAFQGLSPWAFGPRKLMKKVLGYDSHGRER
jgi:hypothetical protein